MNAAERNDWIEAYLSGQLQGEALAQFEKALQTDATLAREVAVYREMYTALQPSQEDELNANLTLLGKKYVPAEPASKNHRYWWIGAALALLTLGLWWLKTARPNKTSGKQVIENQIPPNRQDTLLENGLDTPPDSSKNNTLPPVAKDQRRSDTTNTAELLAANFEPNPALEALLNSDLRGQQYRFNVLHPTPNARLTYRNGQAELAVDGTLETPEASVSTPFRVLLFSNKQEDYRQFKPVLSEPLALEKTNLGFRFSFDKSLRLPQGLYYLMIEDEDSGKSYFVIKVRVIQSK